MLSEAYASKSTRTYRTERGMVTFCYDRVWETVRRSLVLNPQPNPVGLLATPANEVFDFGENFLDKDPDMFDKAMGGKLPLNLFCDYLLEESVPIPDALTLVLLATPCKMWSGPCLDGPYMGERFESDESVLTLETIPNGPSLKRFQGQLAAEIDHTPPAYRGVRRATHSVPRVATYNWSVPRMGWVFVVPQARPYGTIDFRPLFPNGMVVGESE